MRGRDDEAWREHRLVLDDSLARVVHWRGLHMFTSQDCRIPGAVFCVPLTTLTILTTFATLTTLTTLSTLTTLTPPTRHPSPVTIGSRKQVKAAWHLSRDPLLTWSNARQQEVRVCSLSHFILWAVAFLLLAGWRVIVYLGRH
jgi:hypothetical protein